MLRMRFALLYATLNLLMAGSAMLAGVLPALAGNPSDASEPPAVSIPPPKYWSIAMAETMMRRNPGAPGDLLTRWSYYKGFHLYGFEMLWRSTGDPRYLDFIRRQIDPHIDAEGNIKDVSFKWLDNTMPGNLVVFLYEQTGAERYRIAAAQIRKVFDAHPRNADGGFWHWFMVAALHSRGRHFRLGHYAATSGQPSSSQLS